MNDEYVVVREPVEVVAVKAFDGVRWVSVSTFRLRG
jgi:hypothetical protein